MGYGVWLRTSGEVEVVEVNGLHDMQKYVDGYIQVVPAVQRTEHGEMVCLVNEEGLLREDLRVNSRASVEFNNFLVGDALVITQGTNEDGEFDLLPMDKETAEKAAENYKW